VRKPWTLARPPPPQLLILKLLCIPSKTYHVQQAASVVIVGAVHGGEETISNAQLVPSCSLDFSGDQVAMATTLHMALDKMKQASAASTSKSTMEIHGSTSNVSMLTA
jgi:hypothetical protein